MAELLTKIGGITLDSGAEISAFDATSQRLFVVSGQDELQVVDFSDPSNPVALASVDLSAFGTGANSVAVKNGVVAVAVSNTVDNGSGQSVSQPGQVVFLDGAGTVLNAVTVGFLPDMLTFTPDGSKILVANEGEPDDVGDPEGSISIIDVATQAVTTLDFQGFNGKEAALRAEGVRIFPNRPFAEDVEPEYIAVSPDGTQAFVTLQENNAVAVVDLITQTITEIQPLGVKDHSGVAPVGVNIYEPSDPLPVIGTTVGGQDILLGGFSGLFFEGTTATGNLKFVTHTDRGPNGEPTGSQRPFLLPDFTPELVRLELNPTTGHLAVTDRIQLQVAPGQPLTGLPNTAIASGNGNTAYNDEIPVDLLGNTLPTDPLGGDLEGVVVAEDGSFWMVDEYRPAIYHFDANGVLIDRFVPQGTAAAAGAAPGTFGTEVLPEVLAQRRQNRGFEAIAYQDGKLYAFVQSPLRNPTTLSNAALNNNRNVRIVEFDPATQAVREFLYIMDNPNLGTPGNTRADKLGDAVAIGNGNFLVLERDDDAIDSDPLAQIEKKVYRFDLGGATDITGMADPITLPSGVVKTVDQMTAVELASIGIVPIQKTLHVDLATAGYNAVEKIEGLAYINENTLAVINDNDFGVAGIAIDKTTGSFTLLPDYTPEPIQLGIIKTEPVNGLDASDRDGGINIKPQPVFGMYMPDAIASFSANGQTFYITANEGDDRGETVRVRDITLDPTAFPNAAALRANAALGRLNVSSINGDLDGDGDYDQLYAYGSRSFSIWDSQGQQVFDSGDDLEQLTAALTPTLFNADNGNSADFDTRSDNKGPEPEAVTIGQVGDRTLAFVGLERAGGGVMVYDITNPYSPDFVQYVRTDGDISPEGTLFIPSTQSSDGQNLLVVSHEVSNTVAVYEVNLDNTADTIVGNSKANQLFGGAGDDTVAGGLGNDVIFGNSGDDVLRGDRNNRKSGGAIGGDDIIYGGAGNDRIGGKGGNDDLFGGSGNDQIWGDEGDDLIRGGLGNDTLYGDAAKGAKGADTFVLAAGEGTDTIIDFQVGVDFIGLSGGLGLSDLTRSGNTLAFGNEVLAVLHGVDTATLTADSFVAIV